MRIVVRVFARERCHEAVRHEVVAHVVEPHAVDLAEEVREHRSVNDAAGLVLLRLDAPDLLDARLVGLLALAVHVEASRTVFVQEPRTPSPKTVTPAMVSIQAGRWPSACRRGRCPCRPFGRRRRGRLRRGPPRRRSPGRSRSPSLRISPRGTSRRRRETTWWPFFWKKGGVVTRLDREVPEELPEVGLVAGLLDREALLLVVGHEFRSPSGSSRRRRAGGRRFRSLLDDEDHRRLDRVFARLRQFSLWASTWFIRCSAEARWRTGADEEDVDLHAFAFGLGHAFLPFWPCPWDGPGRFQSRQSASWRAEGSIG